MTILKKLLIPNYNSSMISSQNMVILDTSVFIANNYIIDNFIKNYIITIPEIVYLELINLKNSKNSFISFKATTALEEIEYFSIKNPKTFKISRKSNNMSLDKLFNLDFQNRVDGNDNRILATALYYHKVPYNNVYLVSKDKILLYKAKIHGIKTKST